MGILGVSQPVAFGGVKIYLFLKGVDLILAGSFEAITRCVSLGERGEYVVTNGAGVLSILINAGSNLGAMVNRIGFMWWG